MTESAKLRALAPIERIRGRLRVPGDKSLSHRALMFAAIAHGRSRIAGLAPGGDVRSTRHVLETLGVSITDDPDAADAVIVEGQGWTGLDRADDTPVILDCGNAGTTARLMTGLLAGRRGAFRLTGDASLSQRPMGRVVRPLTTFGVRIDGQSTLPLTIHGGSLKPCRQQTEVPSAQVKSALLLAALQAPGASEVREARLTRDHTERLLRSMGAAIEPIDAGEPSARAWRIGGGAQPLSPLQFEVPGDPSSAAYAVALACARPGSQVEIVHLDLNPTRLGFYRLLQRMGADIRWTESATEPEPVGTLWATAGSLEGIEIGPADVVDAIDELPLIAVIAAIANGRTVLAGAGELRHKESDRIAATVALLHAFGAKVTERPDGMIIEGGGGLRGARVEAHGDHRIAMCAAVAAALAQGASALDGDQWVRISYPGFFDDLAQLAGDDGRGKEFG